jgi:hypothetical protein
MLQPFKDTFPVISNSVIAIGAVIVHRGVVSAFPRRVVDVYRAEMGCCNSLSMLLDKEANPGLIARDMHPGKSFREEPSAQFVTSNARGFSAPRTGPVECLPKGIGVQGKTSWGEQNWWRFIT